MQAVHDEYCALFESRLESIINEVNPNVQPEYFAEALKNLDNKDTKDEVLDVVLSLIDYKSFIQQLANYRLVKMKDAGEHAVAITGDDDEYEYY